MFAITKNLFYNIDVYLNRRVNNKMNLKRNDMLKIFFLAVCIIFVYIGFQHLDIIGSFLVWLLQILVPFIIAGCFTFFLNVPLKAIERRLFRTKDGSPAGPLKEKLRRPIAIAMSISMFVLILGIFLIIIIPEITNSLQKIANSIPGVFEQFQDELKNLSNRYDWAKQIIESVNIDWGSISSNIANFITNNVANFFDSTMNLLSSTMKVVSSVINITVNIFLGIVLSVYILAKKEKISSSLKKLLYALFPSKAVDYIVEVGVLTNQSFYNSITGQMMECVIIGTLTGVGMALLGFPYAALVGVVIAICSWIPMFGIMIGTVIGTLFILTVSPVQAIWFIVFMVCLQQIEGNLIYPRVVGSNVGLPPIVMISAIVLFSGFFGIIGLLVSAPVSSVMYTLLKRFVRNRIKSRNIPEEKYAVRTGLPDYVPKRASSDKSKGINLSELLSKIKKKDDKK